MNNSEISCSKKVMRGIIAFLIVVWYIHILTSLVVITKQSLYSCYVVLKQQLL